MIRRLAACLFLATLFVQPCRADDMWTGYNHIRNLYTPHPNTCNSSTEAFVQIGGFGDGFCIEKSERTGQTFEEAKQSCANVDKRLPQATEFVYACTRAGTLGLSNTTDNWEWVGNEAELFYGDWNGGSGNVSGAAAVLAGNGNCRKGTINGVADVNITGGNFAFRCVH